MQWSPAQLISLLHLPAHYPLHIFPLHPTNNSRTSEHCLGLLTDVNLFLPPSVKYTVSHYCPPPPLSSLSFIHLDFKGLMKFAKCQTILPCFMKNQFLYPNSGKPNQLRYKGYPLNMILNLAFVKPGNYLHTGRPRMRYQTRTWKMFFNFLSQMVTICTTFFKDQ
jgi:hypothetical protein